MSLNNKKIQCTVAILTYNNAKTLARALDSVRGFAEIIICDGGSTDDTVSIAQSYGARVLKQDRQFLDDAGRLQNYGGVRNQTLSEASFKWFLSLDSDEYLSTELVEEIAEIVENRSPVAYWVPRKYVYDGKVIDCSITYPNKQMRFFNCGAVTEFIKEVHERIVVRPDATVCMLRNYMLVPFEGNVSSIKQKWLQYLTIESARNPTTSFRAWLRGAFRETKVAVLYSFRLVRNILFCRGNKLPIRLELIRFWYQGVAIVSSLRRVNSW